MSPRAAPRPAPLARLRLRQVQVRGAGNSAGAPVFHVFEELFARALEHPRAEAPAQHGAPRA
jgi:hypothetical protein